MYHLLLTCCLILITFGILVRRYSVETAYWFLAPLPLLTFVIGISDEYFRGIQQFNHRLLHVAYDSSYALLLLGIILVLRAILKRKLIIHVAAGTCLAGIPLAYIFITH
jgi:hypothetical protein